jgi:hypothetical protein
VKQIQIYYNASTDGSLDPGSEHSNIPPILRMIDQHHFLSSTNQEFTGEMFAGQQSEIERNILRKKFKMD